MKKFMLLIMLLGMSLSAWASLGEGTFIGTHNDSGEVTLILEEVPGREGSFFGLINKGDDKMAIYLIDTLKSQTYTMTPLEVTSDGEIGIKNDDPSLVLQLIGDEMKITSSNSSNTRGFTGFLTFPTKKESGKKVWRWVNVIEGDYGDGWSSDSTSLSLSSFDSVEGEAMAIFTTDKISGNFVIREKFPKMYTVNSNSVTSTGIQVKQAPKAIGIFLHSKTIFGNDKVRFYLINPANDQDITKFWMK